MWPRAVILTTDNIESVMQQTGKSHAYLVKMLIQFNAKGTYPILVPIPEKRLWAGW